MRQTLYDLRAKGCDGRVYAGVLSDNHASRHVVEKVGFTYERSAFERVRFGRTTRWQEDPPE
jgi:RimJ/RimL family protein N-acetyltransferase